MQNNHTYKAKSAHEPHFDAIVAAPFGSIGISVRGMQVAIELLAEKYQPKQSENKTVKLLASQIETYIANPFNEFNLPIVSRGTSFQKRVWQVISAIPIGQVLTYGEIARQIGSGARAVANACGANNIPLVIPCHRVVAKNGLGGFMQGDPNGLNIKKWLLNHEGIHV